MSTISQMLEEDSRARLRRMTPAERFEEALALGRSAVDAYASVHCVSRVEARQRLERAGQIGRHPSRVMQDIIG